MSRVVAQGQFESWVWYVDCDCGATSETRDDPQGSEFRCEECGETTVLQGLGGAAMYTRVLCPSCGEQFDVEDDRRGDLVTCDACGAECRVSCI